MAKLATQRAAFDVMDACLQLHGGAGYMREYEIERDGARRPARADRRRHRRGHEGDPRQGDRAVAPRPREPRRPRGCTGPMRRLAPALLAATAALALPAAAQAKEIGSLKVCGPDHCHAVTARSAMNAFLEGGYETLAPTTGGAFYEVRARMRYDHEDAGGYTVLYVPAVGLLRAEAEYAKHKWLRPGGVPRGPCGAPPAACGRTRPTSSARCASRRPRRPEPAGPGLQPGVGRWLRAARAGRRRRRTRGRPHRHRAHPPPAPGLSAGTPTRFATLA